MPRLRPISTLFLHDALPISHRSHSSAHDRRYGGIGWIKIGSAGSAVRDVGPLSRAAACRGAEGRDRQASLRLSRSIDRKSTRLNSSHVKTSYAVFCLKKTT